MNIFQKCHLIANFLPSIYLVQEAKKSLQFYRNIDANSTDKKSLDLIDGELSSLKLVHRKPSDEIEKAENARKWSDFGKFHYE